MNPLFAIGWELSRDYASSGIHLDTLQEQISYCLNFLSVYALAPTLGACLAAVISKHILSTSAVSLSSTQPPAPHLLTLLL
jgi:hypothetical protein